MAKPVFIGAGLGLLLLATVAGILWLTQSKPDTQSQSTGVAEKSTLASSPARNGPGQAVGAAGFAKPDVSASPGVQYSEFSRQAPDVNKDRRRQMQELRAELNALHAQGADASPEKMRQLVDKLEALSAGNLDKEYFQSLRALFEINIQVQKLSQEYKQLASSQAPKDVARREAIAREIQDLGGRVGAETQRLQAHLPHSGTQVVKP